MDSEDTVSKHLATEQDGIELLYRGKSLHSVPFDDPAQYNKFCDMLDLAPLSASIDYSQDFDIPQYYKEIDVEQYLINLIPDQDPVKLQRVAHELEIFSARNLYPVLQLLIYIIDTMRKNHIVWGVGRGSSVASYCLYLIGVHKVDSIKYGLDINEFLK
jgi:DNA polymerase III alpha subunit